MTAQDMQIWAGLGNPGDRYAKNRHNIGFMALDEIAAAYHFESWREKSGTLLAAGRIGNARILLVKPQLYMNKSGLPLAEIARFYKLPVEAITVFHDEIDLAAGKLRIKQAGGHGGHNGLRDIDRHLGQNYWRIRLGVGRPETKQDVHRYVLEDFSRAEASGWLDELLRALSAEAEILASGDQMRYMSRIAFLAPAPNDKAPNDKAPNDKAPTNETSAEKS